jgi:hypothetical protein
MGFVSRLFSSSIMELNDGDSFEGEVNGEKVKIRAAMGGDIPPEDYLRVVVERENGETGIAPASLFASSEKVVQRAIEDAFSDEVDKDEGRSLEEVVEEINN